MPRLIVSQRIFAPCAELVARLRQVSATQPKDEVTVQLDAFLLDPGLGPTTYLTSDGRVVWDNDIWEVAGTWRDALSAIAAGARKTGVRELIELFPPRPPSALDCVDCAGTGAFDAHGQLKDIHGRAFTVVCGNCGGTGWTDSSLALDALVVPKA